MSIDRTTLLDRLHRELDLTGVYALCFHLRQLDDRLDFDDLCDHGYAKNTRLSELIKYFERRNNYNTFVSSTIAFLDTWPQQALSYNIPAPIQHDYAEIVAACRTQVNKYLTTLSNKYDPTLYVHRGLETELNAFFDAPLDPRGRNTYVLVAPTGRGKTNLLCNLARARIEEHRQPVLFLHCRSLDLVSPALLLTTIQLELDLANSRLKFDNPSDAFHVLHDLSAAHKVHSLILLDAINDNPNPQKMCDALDHLHRHTQDKHIKLLITCRDQTWGLFHDADFWSRAVINPLPTVPTSSVFPVPTTTATQPPADQLALLTFSELDQALDRYFNHPDYRITGRPSPQALDHLRNPLLLRFFCEAYKRQDVSRIQTIFHKQLFDEYLKQKLKNISDTRRQHGDTRLGHSIKDEIATYLYCLALHTLHTGVRVIPYADLPTITGLTHTPGDPYSLYRRILEEQIILEEITVDSGSPRQTQVLFVYEAFMEYLQAHALYNTWVGELSDPDILHQLQNMPLRQAHSIGVYLLLIIRQDKPNLLYDIARFKYPWPDLILDATRSIPFDNLDQHLFAVLSDLLANPHGHVRYATVQTLSRLPDARVPQIIITALKDADVWVRYEVVRYLARLSQPSVIRPLISALVDEEERIRKIALDALINLGSQAVPYLIDALSSQESIGRYQAAYALGELKSPLAVQSLIAILNDQDPLVRGAAAQALGRIQDLKAVQPLIVRLTDDDAVVRRCAADVLGRLQDTRAIQPLIITFRDQNPQVCSSAANSLVKIGPNAVAPLIAVLNDENSQVRAKAANALGSLRDPRAVQPLVSRLNDENLNVRRLVARALGRIQDPSAFQPLYNALSDKAKAVRYEAADALEALDPSDPSPPWRRIAALYDQDVDVRLVAVDALSKLQDPRTIEALCVALHDQDVDVRLVAVDALSKLQDPRTIEALCVALHDQDSNIRLATVRALGQFKDLQVVPPLITALKHKDIRIRQDAARSLGKLQDLRAVQPLIDAFNDQHVGGHAANALAKIGSYAVDPLIVVLRNQDRDDRILAARALGQIKDPRVFPPLIIALRDDNEDVRYAVSRALKQLDPSPVWNLIMALNSHDSENRLVAAEELGRLSDHRAVEPLIFALRDKDQMVRKAAAESLAALDDVRAVQPLIIALNDEDANVRATVATALAGLRDPSAIKPLLKSLRDPNRSVRIAVSEALMTLNALKAIISTLRHKDKPARYAATDALRRIGTPEALAALEAYEAEKHKAK